LLFIAHLGDSEVIVVDTEAHRVVKRIATVSHVHGVLAIPELGRVYASATGTNEVVAIDESTLQIIARMPGGTYPDGLAYSPEAHKVYVSDEHGGTDTVIDVVTNARVATVQVGGVIGNTQYDEFSHHMFISAQSANQLVEVDPKTDMIVRRIPVPGAKENHGLLIDSTSHQAFVACQGNDQLIVIDLRRARRSCNSRSPRTPTYWPSTPGSRPCMWRESRAKSANSKCRKAKSAKPENRYWRRTRMRNSNRCLSPWNETGDYLSADPGGCDRSRSRQGRLDVTLGARFEDPVGARARARRSLDQPAGAENSS
jgi:YVTN family beta-propeller protein